MECQKKINMRKIKVFLEVVRELNKNGIIPILFGSFGLYKVINKLENKVNDIDILVPDEFVHQNWDKLVNLMKDLNFELKNEKEHEFLRNEDIISFGQISDLIKLANIKVEKIKETDEDNAKFKELSPEQYLNCYKFMLRDKYRQEKRGNADKEKIALIEKYIQKEIKN